MNLQRRFAVAAGAIVLAASGFLVLTGCPVLGLLPVAPWSLAVADIRGPYLQPGDGAGLVISWFTPSAEIGVVELSADEAMTAPLRRLREEEAATHHVIAVLDLPPGSKWYYRVAGSAFIEEGMHPLEVPPPPGGGVRFAAFGDMGNGSVAQRAIAERIIAAGPQFVVATGDIVYPDGAQSDYDAKFFTPYADLIDRAIVYPSLGNHDYHTSEGGPYLENFILPSNGPSEIQAERVYSFDYGDIHFAALDSNIRDESRRTAMVEWLRQDMLASTARWKVVFQHHPLYMSGTASRRPDAGAIGELAPVFDETGVDLFLCGHNHHYERTLPIRGGQIVNPGQGTIYIITGAGGAALYAISPPADYSAARYDALWSFTQFDVDGPRMTIMQINMDGQVVDRFEFGK